MNADTTTTGRRTPRTTAPGRRTRERIVTAAAQLIYVQGVFKTTIPEVQKAAGVSASQIYHFFGDKDGLVRAVIDYQASDTLEIQPLLGSLDSFETLREWSDAIADHQENLGCRGGCPIGSLVSELSDSNEAAREDLMAAFKRWEAPIRRGLSRMQERGELNEKADVQALATALLAAVQGGLLLTQLHRSTTPLRHATSAVIDHIESFSSARATGSDRGSSKLA